MMMMMMIAFIIILKFTTFRSIRATLGLELSSLHRTSNGIFYLIDGGVGLDYSNSVKYDRVQVLSYIMAVGGIEPGTSKWFHSETVFVSASHQKGLDTRYIL